MSLTKDFEIAPGVSVGGGGPLLLIAGPCVLESEGHAKKLASFAKDCAAKLGVPFIFKASFDKANRTSIDSFRGPGIEEGLEILSRIKSEIGVPVTSDVHEVSQVGRAAETLDLLQVPAFLFRQTDLVSEVARSGLPINLKKAQFVSAWDARHALEKAHRAGARRILVTERGSCFGYNNLVVDFRSFPVLAQSGWPVIFDATHSVQLPSGDGKSSGGTPEFIPTLARAAVAAGVDGIFVEIHDDPPNALSDGANALSVEKLPELLQQWVSLRQALASTLHRSKRSL